MLKTKALQILILFFVFTYGSISHAQINQSVNKNNNDNHEHNINDIDSISFNGGLTEMQILLNNGDSAIFLIENINNVTFNGSLLGEIDSLDCDNINVDGNLINGASTTIQFEIGYFGGNGGSYSGETLNSTGVTGLTATLNAGVFNVGDGVLVYEVSGTPNDVGVAVFEIEVAGETCTVELAVENDTISGLDCANATLSDNLVSGVNSTVQAEINYTDGSGGSHNGQTVSSTGVTGLTAELNPGNFSTGNGTLTYTISGTPSSNGIAIFELEIGGETCLLEVLVDPGTINNLDCNNAHITGTFVESLPVNGQAEIDYTNGNGGAHNGQTTSSTGVTGLEAVLNAGSFSNGNGTLTYTITGTPNSNGTAIFEIEIGGQNCTLEITIDVLGQVTSLDCSSILFSTQLIEGVTVQNESLEIDYIDGNGGVHQGQTVNSSGVTGLTAELSPGNFSNGNGTLIYEVNGTPNGNGIAEFEIEIGGQTCTYEVTVDPAEISSLDCNSATFNTSFVDGLAPNNAVLEIDYTGGNGGLHSGQVVNSTGVTGLTANLASANFSVGNGTIEYEISGTPNGNGIASFEIEIGGQSCVVEVIVDPAEISSLDCNNISITGSLVDAIPASGVSFEVNYTNGNGGLHSGQIVNSTGVTGLTATLNSGNFAQGNGSLTYTISGTPDASGVAVFELDIGGQTCNAEVNVDLNLLIEYPSGSVFCSSGPSDIVEVVNPQTGMVWMDRNLGASQVASSSSDQNSFGDLYQWGRFSDGHQCRNSNTTNVISSTEEPNHNEFITVGTAPFDWITVQNNDLWQGLNGTNNPCPNDYRLPTRAEFNAERLTWNTLDNSGAFGSVLKLPSGGRRLVHNGVIDNINTYGHYWTSTVSGTNAYQMYFFNSNAVTGDTFRANGRSIRCIKE